MHRGKLTWRRTIKNELTRLGQRLQKLTEKDKNGGARTTCPILFWESWALTTIMITPDKQPQRVMSLLVQNVNTIEMEYIKQTVTTVHFIKGTDITLNSQSGEGRGLALYLEALLCSDLCNT